MAASEARAPKASPARFRGLLLRVVSAAILGPLLTGFVALTTHSSQLAIVSVSILFIIGAAFLSRVKV